MNEGQKGDKHMHYPPLTNPEQTNTPDEYGVGYGVKCGSAVPPEDFITLESIAMRSTE